jgi:hypothetical protein
MSAADPSGRTAFRLPCSVVSDLVRVTVSSRSAAHTLLADEAVEVGEHGGSGSGRPRPSEAVRGLRAVPTADVLSRTRRTRTPPGA